jgi:hypothetical protein
MKKWLKPEIRVLIENIDDIKVMTLSIESSLYASGCHHGMC